MTASNQSPDQPQGPITLSSSAKQNRIRKAAKGKRRGKAQAERKRTVRTFPAASFEEALTIANAIQQFAAGQPIRRLRLFEQLGKSPDSGPSRQLITNSAKYGLTK